MRYSTIYIATWLLSLYVDKDKVVPTQSPVETTLRPNGTDFVYEYEPPPLEVEDTPRLTVNGSGKSQATWVDWNT